MDRTKKFVGLALCFTRQFFSLFFLPGEKTKYLFSKIFIGFLFLAYTQAQTQYGKLPEAPSANTQTSQIVLRPQSPLFPSQQHTTVAAVPTVTTRRPNPFKLAAQQKIEIGQPCTLNADCVPDAYCNGNTRPPSCQCLSTHVDISGKCKKSMFLIILGLNLVRLDNFFFVLV